MPRLPEGSATLPLPAPPPARPGAGSVDGNVHQRGVWARSRGLLTSLKTPWNPLGMSGSGGTCPYPVGGRWRSPTMSRP